MRRGCGSLIILLFLLMPVAFAQSQDDWSSKIYSGHWYPSKKPAHPNEDGRDLQCTVEFKSPVSFTHQVVADIPEHLVYFIRFSTAGALKKFTINIYTTDDEEYAIDPYTEGQVSNDSAHRLFDSYLVYLVLGQNINHLEIVSSSGENKGKYILDQMQIKDGTKGAV